MSETNLMQPEVGQILHGCATGSYECPDYVEAFLMHILNEIERVYWNRNQERWEQEDDPKILGITFNSYYWGDCSCGYDKRESEWCSEHHHSDECYRSRVNDDLKSHGWTEQDWDGVMILQAPKSTSYKDQRAIEDKVRQKWCAHFDLSYPQGCAVHCTCSFQSEWREWRTANDHDPKCGIVAPNFAFGDAQIRWYKHPGRGTSVNVAWDERQWRQWFDSVLVVVRAADKRP